MLIYILIIIMLFWLILFSFIYSDIINLFDNKYDPEPIMSLSSPFTILRYIGYRVGSFMYRKSIFTKLIKYIR
jgi:hypothetical protein